MGGDDMSGDPGARRETAELTDRELQEPQGHEEEAAPRELESALLTLSMFGGLLVFGLGCMILW